MSNNVVVVGLGYVGLPLAVLAAQRGYDVIGIDIDESRVSEINDGKSPIEDPALVKALASKPFQAKTSFDPIETADVVFIAVPTPVKNELPDLSILKSASESVARKITQDCLVIIESTINPGVCDDEIIPIFEKITEKEEGKDFYLAHCPERINPGKVPADAIIGNKREDTYFGLEDINRVVGSNSKTGLEKAMEVYDKLLDSEIKPMLSIKEAEAVKVVENSFRDINIAFVNELAMSFHRMGINLENVIDGAATKPYGYMPFRPGPGVGGHCIPVDPYYLIEYARGFGFDHDFLRLARRINNGMPDFVTELTQDALNEKGIAIKGSTIALLGLAYKPNVDDDRESPSYKIQEGLISHGAKVIAFDPHSKHNSDVDSLDAALKNVDAIVLATDHDEFKKINSGLLKKNKISVLIDGRNMFRETKDTYKQNGISYVGIGQS